MRHILFIILLLVSFGLKSQLGYTGQLGKTAITLLLSDYNRSNASGFYVYNKYHTAIPLLGTVKSGTLELVEKNKANKKVGTLIFEDFDVQHKTLKGQWINAKTGKSYPVSLKKDFKIDYSGKNDWISKEVLQATSTKTHYFKTTVAKENRLSQVKVFNKRTNKLLQSIDIDCDLRMNGNVSVGDFNFDGFDDFSVFKEGYSGPNTSSLYFLYNPANQQYSKAEFGDELSLNFDAKTKTVTSTNSCCAGTSIYESIFKLVDNKLVLIKALHHEYDEALGKHVTKEIKQK